MVKKLINIETAIVKLGKSGKNYTLVNSKLYVFDKEMGRKFEDNIGKNYEVEVDDATDFHKIKQIYEEVKDGIELKPVKPDEKEEVQKVFEKSEIIAKIILLLNQL